MEKTRALILTFKGKVPEFVQTKEKMKFLCDEIQVQKRYQLEQTKGCEFL